MKESLYAITALTSESAAVNRSTSFDEEKEGGGEQKRRKRDVVTDEVEDEDEDEENEEEEENENKEDIEIEDKVKGGREVEEGVKLSSEDLDKKDKEEFKGREADKSRERHTSSISLFYTSTLDIETTEEEDVNDAPYSPSSTW